jgi:hypothetical protein
LKGCDSPDVRGENAMYTGNDETGGIRIIRFEWADCRE